MQHDGHRRHRAQPGVGDEGRGDDHAVAEVVHAVAHQHRVTAAAGLLGVEGVMVIMTVAFVVVHVAEQLDLLEQPEEQQPRQQRCEQHLRSRPAMPRMTGVIGTKGLGQDMQQGGAQQHTG